MVALNYQTPDVPMAVNAAMFEQAGNCGYKLKPRALWDPTHPLFGKFNPLSKELVHCSALILQLTVRGWGRSDLYSNKKGYTLGLSLRQNPRVEGEVYPRVIS